MEGRESQGRVMLCSSDAGSHYVRICGAPRPPLVLINQRYPKIETFNENRMKGNWIIILPNIT